MPGPLRTRSVASLGAAISLTWLVVPVVATIVAIAAAWPVGLFLEADVGAGFVRSWVVVAVFASAWALRTSIELYREEERHGDRWRSPWPPQADRQRLTSAALLDRRGQPGRAATGAGDVSASLRGGERGGRDLVLARHGRVMIAAAGTPDVAARLFDVDRELLAEARAGGPPQVVQLGPGTYRLELARSGDDPRRSDANAWWVGA